VTNLEHRTDVAIIGGGPAGLACGIALRQRHIECTIIEALEPGIDKGCGEGLMPDALSVLSELGVDISESEGHRFRGIRFANSHHSVDADFPNGIGIGVRRVKLHRRLAQRAEEAGVHLRWRSQAQLLNNECMLVNGEELQFRVLVGADGLSSGVRKWAGLDACRTENLRFGMRRHYKIRPWSDYVEVRWGPRGQIYVTPVGEESICVAAITRDAQEDRWDLLEDFPEIAGRLRGAQIISRERGAVSVTRKLRSVERGSVTLIGDASGSVDAITGEGLAISFRQAQALAEAVSAGNLELYAGAHAEIEKLPHAMSRLMLMMDRRSSLEKRALAMFAAEPWLFEGLLRVHVGAESLSKFILRNGVHMGWELMRPTLDISVPA
jgi:flavin-dependent dehydrogenase